MEEREASDTPSPDSHAPERSHGQTVTSVAKRKAEDTPDTPPLKHKRAKFLSPSPSVSSTASLRPCAGLPPAVWQHVFLFCSLADLGTLIQVNQSFLSYLTDVPGVSSSTPHAGRLRLLKSESLWASARNALSTKPPKPLPGFSELQMWQLAWSKRCQFCNKVDSFMPGEKIWHKGPGETGVRTIWPFAIRACGSCLLQYSQTDASLLFSAASALRPALPFALITHDRHYVAAHTLRNVMTPVHVEIGKYYYQRHVEATTQELNDALSLGPAAAEEWSKGLDAKGQERMKLAENWEHWEVRHQLSVGQHGMKRAASTAPSITAVSHRDRSKSPVIHAPVPATPYSQYFQARPPTVPPHSYTPHPVPTGSTAPSGRNLHDAIEAKANRKTDIEQRCQQMNPPILPNILHHMESFRAAIQIPQPMNDHAWGVLRPRLLAQLEAAEQAEADHLSRAATLPIKPTDRRHQDGNTREAKEALDRDWEESQKATRERLNITSDDFTNQDWDHGSAVTFENSPKFAADLLTYVRRTFYTNRVREGSPLLSEQGLTPGNMSDIKSSLVLDDMKWVYDNKVKPLVEQFRREVFLCSGSDCDRNTRFYGFEGIVQHYGARHTNSFSVGNVVVAWREAEWPEDPPFHADPISVKNAQHSSAISAGINNYYSGFSRAGTSTPHMPPYLPHASPSLSQYAGQQYNGPYPPPQATSSTIPGFTYTQGQAPPDHYSYPVLGTGGYVSQAGHNSYLPSPAMTNPLVAPSPILPLSGQGVTDIASNGSEDVTSSTSSYDKQVSTIIQNVQDTWKQTSGIKDMPNSLRIYVLLHRVISKFHVEFNHEPKLTHIIDAYSNHEVSKALKHAPGLSCKACQIESSYQLGSTSNVKLEERKTYTVLNLLLHFRTQHWPSNQSGPGQGQHAQRIDWKEDMIELPSERFISGLIHAPGMDNEKLLVVATVFPRLFPMPLPKIDITGSHGPASPSSSFKDLKGLSDMTGMLDDTQEHSGLSPSAPIQTDLPMPRKEADDEPESQRLALTTQAIQVSNFMYHKQPQRDSSPTERWQQYHTEPRYYVSREQLDDGYSLPRKYVEYRTSPRVAPAGLVFDGYIGRRDEFQDQEVEYGPPQEGLIYALPPNRSQAQEQGNYSRQVRYHEENQEQTEYRYIGENQSREVSPYRGQSAADRFLDELVPGQALGDEPNQPSLPLQPGTKRSPSFQAMENNPRHTPPTPNVPSPSDPEDRHRPLAAPRPKPPSTMSNNTRYEESRSEGRHIPLLDPTGRPRRAGPHRRRDRLFEQRVPSRFYRYMSIARDDPYGRGSSMSRSQSRRYEEQRRRLDQQETTRPRTDHDYRPAYSRGTSVDHQSPEDDLYQHPRLPPRDYVSIQDRLHPHSPPRYRYDEPRGPQSVYIDEYGQPLHEYGIIRVRGDSRQPHNSYHQPSRYEPGHYQYVPVTYERSLPKRYNSRAEEYVIYEGRERSLPNPPASDADNEVYEPPPEIKIESASVSGPEGP